MSDSRLFGWCLIAVWLSVLVVLMVIALGAVLVALITRYTDVVVMFAIWFSSAFALFLAVKAFHKK